VFRDFPRTLRFFSKLGDRLWRVSSGFVVFNSSFCDFQQFYGGFSVTLWCFPGWVIISDEFMVGFFVDIQQKMRGKNNKKRMKIIFE